MHVVNGETQLFEMVLAKGVLVGCVDEHAVSAVADRVEFRQQMRRVPDIDAVAAFVHAQVCPALDQIVRNQCMMGTVHIDTRQIVQDPVVSNGGTMGGFGQFDTGIQCLVRHPRPRQGQALKGSRRAPSP